MRRKYPQACAEALRVDTLGLRTSRPRSGRLLRRKPPKPVGRSTRSALNTLVTMQPAKLSLFDYIRATLVLIAFYVAVWVVVIVPFFLLFNTRYPRMQKIMWYLV